MSLALEKLTAMLGSGFAKGQAELVSLLEDDSDTIVDFCRIVHHQAEEVEEMWGEALFKLSMLADMRFCHSATRS
jgi:hypothetical protein